MSEQKYQLHGTSNYLASFVVNQHGPLLDGLPDYQVKNLRPWSKAQEQQFIDLLLQGFVTSVITIADVKGKKVIVQGHRELRAIANFLHDGLDRLAQDEQRMFEMDSSLLVRFVRCNTEADVEELFMKCLNL